MTHIEKIKNLIDKYNGIVTSAMLKKIIYQYYI